MTRVVCNQLAPVLGDLEENARRSTAAVRAAVDDGADVIVLPELITSGYMFQSIEEVQAAALVPGEAAVLAAWAAEAARGGAVVIGGFPERAADGAIYNSAAVLDGDGLIGIYRKCHLWDQEKLWFTPGDAPPGVFETRHGRIGVLVCYDLEFPEMPRTLGLAGAELIAVPTNWPFVERPDGEHAPEVMVGMAAARVNRVFIACCDRAGPERGQEWNEGTAILDLDGWVLDAVTGVGAARADIDLARTHVKKYTGLADAFGDRRPELYGAVSAQDPRMAE
jgi:predicted amidohydrolase